MSGYLVNFIVTILAAIAVFAAWVANRKRIAAETVGRAEEQALRITKDAERDAESRKKEALLDAKEKAHELLMEAERQARIEANGPRFRGSARDRAPRTAGPPTGSKSSTAATAC
jgi:ribonuclease Y